MAKEMTWSTLIYGILGILAVIIILFSLFYFDVIGKIEDVFPFFEKGNVSVYWEEEYFLEYPEELLFWYHTGKWGNSLDNLYYRYREDVGWQWLYWKNAPWFGKSSMRHWITINSEFKRKEVYKELKKQEKEFINSLSGKTPEQGLKLLIERTLNSKGGWFSSPSLWIGIGCDEKAYICYWKTNPPYEQDSKELKDLDALIYKFNRITKSAILKRKGEIKNV